MLILGLVGAGVPALAGFAGRLHPWLELCCHFRLQYVFVFLSLSFAFVAIKRHRLAAVAGLGFLLNAAVVLPWYFGGDDKQDNEVPALKVMLSNVLSSNGDAKPLLALVAREKPDVIALLEVTPVWLRRLAPLRRRFRYRVERPRVDNFGIALYSRLPLANKRVHFFSSVPSIGADVVLPGGRRIYVLATHPVPPLHSMAFARRRDAHLEKLTAHIRTRARRQACVVVGDLNATQFSPVFSDLVAHGKLRSCRRGYGVQPTWPVGLWPMTIPLDHVLHSAQLRTLRSAVLAPIGSDHLPVLAALGWAKK